MSDKPDPVVEGAMLNNETGVIAWEELARHFARGVVIAVDTSLDLVDAAQAVLKDDATRVGQWQNDGKLRRASDDDARRWHAENSEFWAIVIAPWVIVQEKDKSTEEGSTVDDKSLH